MSSPNEPGQAGSGDNAGNGSGPGDRSGGGGSRPAGPNRLTDQGPPTTRLPEVSDVPPWQRGASRAAPQPGSQPPARAADAAPRTEQRAEQQRPGAAPPAGPPSGESRAHRYITGTAAPGALQQQGPPKPAPGEAVQTSGRNEVARAPEYSSELPDLSASGPRPAQRKPAERTEPNTRPAGSGKLQVGSRAKAGPVRASMQIRRIDPWSALKVSLLLSIALFFVWMIAVAFLYLVLGGMGVWSKLNSNVGDLLTSTSGSGGELVSAGSIFGGALMIGLVNIVLLTAMATIGAFIYNLSTDIVGGVEVTLADRE